MTTETKNLMEMVSMGGKFRNLKKKSLARINNLVFYNSFSPQLVILTVKSLRTPAFEHLWTCAALL